MPSKPIVPCKMHFHKDLAIHSYIVEPMIDISLAQTLSETHKRERHNSVLMFFVVNHFLLRELF